MTGSRDPSSMFMLLAEQVACSVAIHTCYRWYGFIGGRTRRLLAVAAGRDISYCTAKTRPIV